MDTSERMHLQKMINENNVEDYTTEIRTKKHSDKIKQDVQNLITIKHKYPRLSQSNPDQFDKMCISQCGFIFTHYTDIYNKVKKDELNLNILMQFLVILKQIEDEQIDQHTGAFQVGKLLKEMYIDSALTKAEKIDKKTGKKIAPSKPSVVKKISWQEYKAMNDKAMNDK
jgi:hypothetical protein